MKAEEQRIAIAKYLAEIEGFYRLANGGTAETVPLQYLEPGSDGGLFLDYCGDLNAMHVAEKALTADKRQHYYDRTYELLPTTEKVNDEPPVFIPSQFAVLHATAAQRAEPFLRTVGRWVE